MPVARAERGRYLHDRGIVILPCQAQRLRAPCSLNSIRRVAADLGSYESHSMMDVVLVKGQPLKTNEGPGILLQLDQPVRNEVKISNSPPANQNGSINVQARCSALSLWKEIHCLGARFDFESPTVCIRCEGKAVGKRNVERRRRTNVKELRQTALDSENQMTVQHSQTRTALARGQSIDAYSPPFSCGIRNRARRNAIYGLGTRTY